MAQRSSSVCLSVNFCANRFSHTNGWIATKLSQDGLQVSVHPGCAQGQGQRSCDTGTFVLAQKSLLLPSPPNFHKMDSRSACIQGVLKVKVKGHVIGALSWILGMSYSVTDGLVFSSFQE